MSIVPNAVYNSFAYIINGSSDWVIERPNMDGDFVAGLLAALVSILIDNGSFTNKSARITSNNNVLDINLNRDTYLLGLDDYYIMSSSYDKVSEDIDLPINQKFMGWWIKVPYIDNLDLYTFSRESFINGFVYMSNIVLGRDFRKRIHGGPFIYNKGYQFIEVPGYDMPSMSNINKDINPYPIDDDLN